jgi:Integrase core domain
MVVDHIEHAQAPGRTESIRHEVQAPALGRLVRHRHRIARPGGSLTSKAALHRQAFFLLEPPQLLVVHGDAFTFEHQPDPPIAEAPTLGRDLTHASPELRIVRHGFAPGSRWENVYCQSFNAKIRDEFLNRELLSTLKEAQIPIAAWRRHANTVRPR